MSSPSPSRVALRALAIAAVIARAYLEEGGADAHVEGLRKEIVSFLRELDAESALLEPERKLIARPVGRLSPREQADASWLCEGLAVIAWSLGRGELPWPDSEIDPRRVVDSVGFMRPEAQSLCTFPTLRPVEELAIAQARLALVLERLRAFAGDRSGPVFEALARDPAVLAGVPLADGDLRIGGAPLQSAEESRWREALDAAEERVKAIAWVCGGAPYGYGG